MNPKLILAGLAVLLSAGTPAAPLLDEGLRAGAAKVDITPEQPCQLCGYALRTELSTGVHDPLSARALAFEQGSQRLVLLSCDLIGFYGGTAEHLRQAICDAAKLRPEELFLAGIHTHSAPTLALDPAKAHANNVAYTQALEAKLIGVVQNALASLQPATIGVGSGASPAGINRRQRVAGPGGKPRIQLGRNPGGGTDPEVQVLQVRARKDDRRLAILFAYATHSTSLGAKNLAISGDVHGLTEQFVENHLGEGVIVPGFAGASGDIDPWFRVLPFFKTGNGWISEPVLLGTFLGEEVVTTADTIRQDPAKVPLQSSIKTVELPTKPGTEFTDYTRRTMTISVARIGEVAIAGFSGELFHEIGKAIKAASPFSRTLILTHCNGGSGYLVTKDAYAEGGYEVKATAFAPEAAGMVVQEATALLAQLRGPAEALPLPGAPAIAEPPTLRTPQAGPGKDSSLRPPLAPIPPSGPSRQ